MNVTDGAGNSASFSSPTVKIDKTAPTLTYASAAPPANPAGWNNTDVTFAFTTGDNLSEIAGTSPANPLVLSTEGLAVSGSVNLTDGAGNSASFPSPTVKIDKTAPTLTYSPAAPAPNPAGWNNTDVTFSLTTGDNLSEVAGTSPANPLVLSTEGLAVSGSVNVTDGAGNTASFPSPTVKIDKTAPPVPDLIALSDSGVFPDDDVTNVDTPTFDGSAEPDSTVTLFAEDVLGDDLELGSDTATAGSYSVTSLEDIADGFTLITATATDVAGNTSIPSAGLPLIIDTEAPSLTVPDAGFEVNATTALGAEVDLDALVSASDSTPGDLTVVCTPTTHILPGAIYPLGVTTTVRCTVSDAAGNSSEKSFDITVVVQQVNVNINPSALNLNGRGVVPVALLSGDGFDPSLVDPLTVRFGVVGTEAPPEHGGHLADDSSQLKLHFRYSELDIDLTQEGDTVIELVLTGSLSDGGAPFEGVDSVRLVRNFSPIVIEPDPAVLPSGAGDPVPGQGNGGNGNSGQGNGGNGNGNSGQGNNGNGNNGNGNSGQANNSGGNGNSGQGNNGNGNGNSGQGNNGDPGGDNPDGGDDDGPPSASNAGGNGGGNGNENGGGNGNGNAGGNGNGNGK